MLSYHGSEEVKDQVRERYASAHHAGRVVQDIGWSEDSKCGCWVGSVVGRYCHASFSDSTGFPICFVHLVESVFERLPLDEARIFGAVVFAAVPVGVDLDAVVKSCDLSRIDRMLLFLNEIRHEQFARVARDDYLPAARECLIEEKRWPHVSLPPAAEWLSRSKSKTEAAAAFVMQSAEWLGRWESLMIASAQSFQSFVRAAWNIGYGDRVCTSERDALLDAIDSLRMEQARKGAATC